MGRYGEEKWPLGTKMWKLNRYILVAKAWKEGENVPSEWNLAYLDRLRKIKAEKNMFKL